MVKTEDIRNVILMSHAGAGKTSLGEAILFNTGATTRFGKVEEGNTISDYSKDEIERKVSINTSILHTQFQGALHLHQHLQNVPVYTVQDLHRTVGEPMNLLKF